jgi:hypothetical protein
MSGDSADSRGEMKSEVRQWTQNRLRQPLVKSPKSPLIQNRKLADKAQRRLERRLTH